MNAKTTEERGESPRRREKNPPRADEESVRSEEQIDEALGESMGASEPPAHSVPVKPFNEDGDVR